MALLPPTVEVGASAVIDGRGRAMEATVVKLPFVSRG
jgi:hypothetical protein